MLEDLYISDLWVRIFYSIICGFIIGAERQVRGKPVGIRTSTLICIGSMLFIYLSRDLHPNNNPTRVLGQLVTGIGFLGAGVILNRQGSVTGMTSAAVIWLLAAIGAAIGFEKYATAVTICLVSVLVLIGVQLLEDIFKVLKKGVHRNLNGE